MAPQKIRSTPSSRDLPSPDPVRSESDRIHHLSSSTIVRGDVQGTVAELVDSVHIKLTVPVTVRIKTPNPS